MKRYFSRPLTILALAIVLTVTLVYAAGDVVTIPLRAGTATSTVTNTIVNADIDTVKFNREAGISGLSFGLYAAESVTVDFVIVRRVINGVLCPAVAGDTIITADTSSAATFARTKTVTLAPLAEAYWFFVDYGGAGVGVTSPTMRYSVNKQYNY